MSGESSWKLKMRLRAAESWPNRRKKLQKELRDVDRLSFVSKEMQESIVESLQRWLQEVEKKEA